MISVIAKKLLNQDVHAYYTNFAQDSFARLVSSEPEVQLLVLDVIDLLRALAVPSLRS